MKPRGRWEGYLRRSSYLDFVDLWSSRQLAVEDWPHLCCCWVVAEPVVAIVGAPVAFVAGMFGRR